MITEAPLYSMITVNRGNIYNGCIFGIIIVFIITIKKASYCNMMC